MITLASVVQLVMLEARYKKCNKSLANEYALDAYRAQTRQAFYIKKSITATVDNMRIKFPPSYLKWTKLGVCEGGEIAILSIDDNMCSATKVCSCEQEQVQDSGNGCDTCTSCGGFYGGWFANGGFYGRAFGGAVIQNPYGYFSVDTENKQFLFNSDLDGKEIIIEFISLDTYFGVDTEVDTFLKPILANKVRIQLEMQMERPDYNKIQMLEMQTKQLESDQILNSQSWSFNELFKAAKANYGMIK